MSNIQGLPSPSPSEEISSVALELTPESLASLLSHTDLKNKTPLQLLNSFFHAARDTISDINRNLDHVAAVIRSDPDPQHTDRALEMLRGVQGRVDLMVGWMGTMDEIVGLVEASLAVAVTRAAGGAEERR